MKSKMTLAVLALPTLMVLSAALCLAQISFAPAQNYPLTAVPFRVVAGDLNGDGKPDLAVLSIYGGTISILLNHGNGTFEPPRGFAALTPDPAGPTFLSGITLGDVNGDHKPDVILSHTTDVNSGDGIINVLLGNGDGTLQPPISTPIGSFAYRFVGVGDFNSDGRLDVACIADDAANTMQLVVLFLGNGDGTFARFDSSQNALVDAALADLNHDQKFDMVAANTNGDGSGHVTVLLGKGDGTFQTPLDAPTPAPALFSLVGDFNHDGKPDLLTTSYQKWSCKPTIPPTCGPTGPAGGVSVLLGNGNGTFTGTSFSGELGPSVEGDYDGDGNLDFAAAAVSGQRGFLGSFTFFLGNGRGQFSSPITINQPEVNLVTEDLDGDGFADSVWPSSSSLQVALNDTSTFTLAPSAPGPPSPAGGIASYTISVAQQHGQDAMVSLSCSGPSGSGIRCSVSPSSVAAGGTSTLNVTITGPSAGVVLPSFRRHKLLQYAIWLPLPLGAVFVGGIGLAQARRKRLLGVVIGCALGAVLVFQAACGGGGPPSRKKFGTPPGTYTITVTGTAGTISRSTNVSLTVQ
jgi:hypothetical protein